MEKVKRYKKPSNSTALTRVKVNSLIWDMLKPRAKMADLGFQKLQAPLAAAMTAVAQLADKLKEKKQRDLLALAMDAPAIMGRVDRDLNFKRQEVLQPEVSTD